MEEETLLSSYLSFKLGDELFAANVSKVLNILELSKITKVPQAPEYMKGVINLRGSVLPLVDTRIKFGLIPTEFTTNTCILVLNVTIGDETIQIGGLVDAVQEVLEIESQHILPPPNLGNKYQSKFISGIYKKANDDFTLIVDMNKLFTVNELDDVKIFSEIVTN